ncbi:MAG: type I methionyl aminopeptidase [Treponema sp.]|jgi:methionyl aminopeptidase|nr:type I methionyl aminopeptidase [Treponema sp.]
MIRLKNEKQIDGIRKSCKMLSAMYRELIPLVKPGIQTVEIDMWVRDWIKKAGGKPIFLGYTIKKKAFPAAICISINEEVIHGIPSKRRIREGDLVSLDCGIDLGGFISDQAVSIEAGKVSDTVRKLSKVTRECLYKGIEAAKAGERLLLISRAVEKHARSFNYGIVESFCGHGVGLALHEDPQVPNYPHGPNPKLRNGMVIAIEPMINIGAGSTETLDDGWTVVTADGQISAHWEHTVAVFNGEIEVLTEEVMI